MKVSVFIEREKKEKTVDLKGKMVRDLLQELKINPVSVIVTQNNEVVTEDAPIKDKDKIKVLSVVCGG